MKVYANLQFSGPFFNKQDRAAIYKYTGINLTFFQNILYLIFYFCLLKLTKPLPIWFGKAFLALEGLYSVQYCTGVKFP